MVKAIEDMTGTELLEHAQDLVRQQADIIRQLGGNRQGPRDLWHGDPQLQEGKE